MDFKEARNALKDELRTSKYGIFDQVETQCEQKDKFVSEQTKSIKDMYHNFNYLIEYREVLRKVRVFIENQPSNIHIHREKNPFGADEERKERNSSEEHLYGRFSASSEEDAQIGLAMQQHKALNLSSIAGIINREDIHRIKRIVFRASRGNALIHTIPMEKSIKEYSGEKVDKDVYIITFQEGEALRAKLTRI